MTESDLTDEAIAALVLAGDRDQFEVLVRRYFRPLQRVAVSRVGRPDWAEDLVQETFLAAFKSLHTYNSQYSFRTWLWTILLNQCRRALTKHQRREAIVAQSATSAEWEHELIDEQAVSPAVKLAEGDRNEQINLLLSQLNEEQATAIRLRFFGQLKFQEIADATRCSLSTAKARVRFGLRNLSQLIARDSVETDSIDSDNTNGPQGNSASEDLL